MPPHERGPLQDAGSMKPLLMNSEMLLWFTSTDCVKAGDAIRLLRSSVKASAVPKKRALSRPVGKAGRGTRGNVALRRNILEHTLN